MYYHIWRERVARWDWIGNAPPGAHRNTTSNQHYLYSAFNHCLRSRATRNKNINLVLRKKTKIIIIAPPSLCHVRGTRLHMRRHFIENVAWPHRPRRSSCIPGLSWGADMIYFINIWASLMGAVVAVWWVINYSANAIEGPLGHLPPPPRAA